MSIKIMFAAASVFALLAVPAAAAENGTTLAGPAQGSKANGSSSMSHPSAESGASGGAMTKEGAGAGTATGTMSGGSTATGGNAGGPAGRN